LSTSFNTPGTRQSEFSIPKPSAKIAGADGICQRDWWRYLLSFTSAPAKEIAVTVGASPTDYTAVSNGTLLVVGGTVSSIALKRLNSITTGLTSGLIPLSVGDTVTLAYSVIPTLVWYPR
jgi:hypothetical protein